MKDVVGFCRPAKFEFAAVAIQKSKEKCDRGGGAVTRASCPASDRRSGGTGLAPRAVRDEIACDLARVRAGAICCTAMTIPYWHRKLGWHNV
jgi:hypothetical protein